MDDQVFPVPTTEPLPAAASPLAAAAPTPGDEMLRARRPRSRWDVLWREWFRPLLIIAVVMFSFRSAVADWNDVPTGSMKPTILEGDRIFINKIAYDLKFPFTTWRLAEWDDPTWGDIVVLRSPEDGKRLVKRVVALPDDVVEVLRDGRLFLNGEEASYLRLDDDVINQIDRHLRSHFVFHSESFAGKEHPVMMTVGSSTPRFEKYRVPEDHFFVMGDNRSNSRDSRWFGAVHRDAILGRATAVALSVDPERHYMPRWERFFSRLR